MRVLGVDPSLTGLGWCVYNHTLPETCTEWGEIISESKLPEPVRYRTMQNGLESLVLRVKPELVAIETPAFGASYSEGMYALFVCLQQVLCYNNIDTVFVGISQLKGYVAEAIDHPKGLKITKREILGYVKEQLNLRKALRQKDNNRADAYVLARIGSRFSQVQSGELTETDLTPYECMIFLREHTFTRGKKKGVTERTGLAHREGSRYFKWSEVVYGNEEARIIIESPERAGAAPIKEGRKPRGSTRSKSPKAVASAHPDGFIDLGLLDRWSSE
jgi:Holliday junction resolvasome RuvABC endonuclease subunit